MIKIGIIGAGCIAESHMEVIKNIPGFKLAGFYSSRTERINEIIHVYKIYPFATPEELIKNVDAIDITSTIRSHHDLVVEALKNAKHVYIENPIINSLEEADHIIKIAEEADVTVQVGQSNRYNPAYLSVKSHIGNPQYIQIIRKNKFSLLNKDVHIVLGSMINDIDIVLSIMKSKVRRIKAKAINVITERNDVVNVRLEFDNGAVADLTTNGISEECVLKTDIFQNGGHIYIDFLKYKNEITRLKNEDEKINLFNFDNDELIVDKPEIKNSNPIREEFLNFHHSVITHSTSLQTLEERFEALKIAHDILHKLLRYNSHRKEILGYSNLNLGYFN